MLTTEYGTKHLFCKECANVYWDTMFYNGKEDDDIFETQDRHSLTRGEYFRFIDEHEKAYRDGNMKLMKKIEDRLEDINFHPECKALSEHNYNRARELWEE